MEIDSFILELHKCSSQDFLHLNRLLPSYNHPFKELHDLFQKFFAYHEAPDRQDFLMHFDLFCKSVQSLRHIYSNTIDIAHNRTQDLKERTDSAYFIIKNLQQNLHTIRFLSERAGNNLKPSAELIGSPTVLAEIEGLNQRLQEDILKIKDKLADSLREAKGTLIAIGHQQKSIEQAALVLGLIDTFITDISTFSGENAATIRELEESFETNVSHIITNLQYEDIIRQKIGHISQTHAQVVNNITDTGNQDNNQLLNQVSEIVILQAAHLIHANKQYQQAISKIVNSFISLNNILFKLSKKSKILQRMGPDNEAIGNKSVCEALSDICNVLVIQCNKFANKTLEPKAKSSYPRLDILLAGYLQSAETLRLNAQKSGADTNYSETLYSLIQQVSELKNTLKNILDPMDEGCQHCQQTEKHKQQLIANYQALELFMAQGTYKNIDFETHLTHGNLKAARKIEKSIRNVRYYDLFDRTIRQIIYKYNEISSLTGKAEETPGNSKSKMEFLRQNYTMESEHLVHSFITNMENIELNELDKNIGQDEANFDNDDGLELF